MVADTFASSKAGIMGRRNPRIIAADQLREAPQHGTASHAQSDAHGVIRTLSTVSRAGPSIVSRDAMNQRDMLQKRFEQVNAQAQKIIEDAKQQAEKIKADAAQEGKTQGSLELVAHWSRLRVYEQSHDIRAQQRTIELARLLAERLVHKQLELRPETIVDLANEALSMLDDRLRVVVRANTNDAKWLRERLIHKQTRWANTLEVVEDPVQTSGNLRFELGQATLEANVGERLDRLINTLKEVIERQKDTHSE